MNPARHVPYAPAIVATVSLMWSLTLAGALF